VVIYLNAANFFDEYAAAHELAHNILYCDGLTKLDIAPDGRATGAQCLLLGRISSALSHFAVNPMMRRYGYDVTGREDARAAAFCRNVRLKRLSACEGHAVACADLWCHCSHSAREALASKAQENERFGVLLRDVVETFESRNLLRNPGFALIETARRELLARFGLTMITRFANPLDIRSYEETRISGDDQAPRAQDKRPDVG
jgi:hypothetical protein